MKETQTLARIHAKVKRYAKRLLKESGYVIMPDLPDKTGTRRCDNQPGEKGLSVVVNVVGYTRRYDGWEYDLTARDWKEILSIQWDEYQRKLLEFMKKNGNENLTLTKLNEADLGWDRGAYHPGNRINKELARNHLPYHFGFTHVEPYRKNGYPSMCRMFKRPVPIDGEETEPGSDEEE